MNKTLLAGTCVAICSLSSCMYVHHLPLEHRDVTQPKEVTMTVGDKRKVMSRTLLNTISSAVLLGPSNFVKSSNPHVVGITGEYLGTVAFVEARSPGRAVIEYEDRPAEITRILVQPKEAQQVVDVNRP